MNDNGDSRLGAAADPAKVKKQAQKSEMLRHREIEDIFNVLATPSGRRFVWRYLTDCGIFKTSFTGNSETFYKEGQRSIGLKLLADVNEADPSAYLKMLDEARKVEEILNG